MTRPVYIVDGRRTPILKARGQPGPFSAADLAVVAAREVLLQYPQTRSHIDELVWGCVMPSVNEANIARIIGLRLGLGEPIPAHTVQRNCASGLQALDTAAQRIQQGEAELVLVGGTEAMSRAPLIFDESHVRWLARLYKARTLLSRIQTLFGFRLKQLKPMIALKSGLTDPVVGLDMGQTAEELAYQFQISRQEMDHFALESHELAVRAQDAGIFDNEIVPLYGMDGTVYFADDGVRRDTSLERLGRLRPVFDRPQGSVTAGNSAQISDGAAALLLASEQMVERLKLPVLGRWHHASWAALDPSVMGLGPVHAMRTLFDRTEVPISEIDTFEINEAFAAQVLACLKVWQDEDYAENTLGCNGVLAPIDPERLNPHGGAVAIGHPVGMTGARLVLHALKQLQRMNGRYAVAALCIGGGQGGAVLLERAP